MMPRARTAAASALLCAALAAAPGSAGAQTPSDGAVVIVARATNACFSATVRVTGFLVARNEALVNLEQEGYRIVEVLANEGDQVTSGQVLARLAQKAGDRNTVAVRAPAAGTVTRSTAVLGATAQPTNPRAEALFRIAVDKEIELEVEVPSIHVPKLGAGQTARVQTEDGRDLNGRLRLVPADIDRVTQLGRARISIDADPALRVGTFARATIDAARSCGVAVPRGAVLYRTEGPSVQVVRDRKVETRRVKIGLLSDASAEIREGLAAGDIVVAVAGTSLRDGDQVKPILADGSSTGDR
jgi:multidrug efflux pump subunit AcrA (membrane-fusion protein)